MEAHTDAPGTPQAPEKAVRIAPLPLRAIQVFYAPGELFARLSERPAWIGALLLGGILVALSFLMIPAEVWQQTIREQMMSSGRPMPEGFDMGGAARWFGLAGGVLFWFVLAFFVAGVITVVFHFLLGDEGRFKQYLAVVSHALIIAAVGGLVVLPLRLAQEDPQLTLNLALFVPGDADSYPLRVLRMVDLFMIWSYLAMAVGMTKVDRRRSWGSAAAFLIVFAIGVAMIFAAVTPGG
jgi:hypothetical protein